MKATEILARIAAAYDEALQALKNSNLDRVQKLTSEIDSLTTELGRPEDMESTEANARLLRQVIKSHSRLLTAVGAERSQTGFTLNNVRKGRQALRSYGNRAQATGTRVSSES